ncbi:MAG: alpha/beta hydrolase [Deltaproteobacteria bacterium]|nr:alpha/beta hydrolase [Deltaproteobacteria bacterium]
MRFVLSLTLALTAAGCLAHHRGPLPGEPAGARFVTENGVRVRVRDVGKGPAVLLLHGFASALETWTTVTPELERNHRVISLDLKGFGWTDRPEGDYSPMAQAALVRGVLDQLGVKEFDLIAHSWGSSVALALALQAPERVQKIALYDAWVFEDQLPSFFRWAKVGGVGEALFALFYKQRPGDRISAAFYNPDLVSEAFVEEIEHALERPGTSAAALAAVRGQNFAELEPKWPSIKNRTLLLWGREDAVTWLEFGERLQNLLPNAELKVYPHCGHFPMLEARAESNRDLLQFLGNPAAAALGTPAEGVRP